MNFLNGSSDYFNFPNDPLDYRNSPRSVFILRKSSVAMIGKITMASEKIKIQGNPTWRLQRRKKTRKGKRKNVIEERTRKCDKYHARYKEIKENIMKVKEKGNLSKVFSAKIEQPRDTNIHYKKME